MLAALDHRPRLAALVAAALAGMLALSATPAVASGGPRVDVVVQAADADAAADAVTAHGGVVDSRLEYVGGVAAELPQAAVAEVDALTGVEAVEDVEVEFHDAGSASSATDSEVQLGSMSPPEHWTDASGAGVGVALLDTGVTETDDLEGRVEYGPDYSGEGADYSGDAHVDEFGHGTFMAGLIAGDGAASQGTDAQVLGVAPGASVVSVKLAGADGATSLSKVLDAIGWVIEHRDDHNIRVLNLSLGVPTERAPQADPLSAAVQAAWASGITVVAAAGNDGDGEVTSPGRDPWAITVGSTDTQGTVDTSDDVVADWSGREKVTSNAKPEVLAPGSSVVSLRAPDSTIVDDHPGARVGDHYFRGSGTSMSAALVSGAAAALIEHRPMAVPDDVKGALVEGGSPVEGADGVAVDLAASDALEAPSDAWAQSHHISVPTEQGRLKAMPWSERTAAEQGSAWHRFYWADDAWQRFYWADGEWQRFYWADGEWQRFYWAGDGLEAAPAADWERFYWADDDAWQRFYWADADWQRFYWADDTWQRFYWAGDGFASLERDDPRFSRFYWAHAPQSTDVGRATSSERIAWHDQAGTRVDFERFYWAGIDSSASHWQQGADWSHAWWATPES